jgi:hypothetical protein
MSTSIQEDLKMHVKLWLKANKLTYAWLAEKCFVSEATMRNWMARKCIPKAKEYIIRELTKDAPPAVPTSVVVEEETVIKFHLDSEAREILGRRARARGMSLPDYLSYRVSVPDEDSVDSEELHVELD